MSAQQTIQWFESPEDEHCARWRSESNAPPPKRVVVADDGMNADTAFRLACEGTSLLWRGDFHNARQLLQAMARRVDRKAPQPGKSPSHTFHLHRQAQSKRARILGMLLLPFEAGHVIPLRRAPDVRLACEQAYGPSGEPYVVSLRELQGVIGAGEWRKKGLHIPALGGSITPHYGVFSPVRGEYVELVAEAPLLSRGTAFDIGTGTGVLAAVLAHRGVKRVVATDQDPRALACARENVTRLGLSDIVDVQQADLFPASRASLIVCNPPWLPGRARTSLEHAVYDPASRMLRGFIDGLDAHLEPGGEGWLILSDLAEHLGLRSRTELLEQFDRAGLRVAGRLDVRPNHPRAHDPADPLHAARKAEVTSLWRLAAGQGSR
ncbi:class I SAM-dependent methyltransferase [Streptomyces sp. NBC_00654]|uniref:class I SAM-dependent methyltransferase n=1 Tax=Streptomyces sp. NBC_00654 TaxID=2975799 RepID=UPI00225480C5|nr:class I SAM-dependent methyltransferase [Streptomyces sp. NBC_00654]MCX4971268.1 class I SAM-dependent methyltransferase [Streptomyces sp. NBC_00654]